MATIMMVASIMIYILPPVVGVIDAQEPTMTEIEVYLNGYTEAEYEEIEDFSWMFECMPEIMLDTAVGYILDLVIEPENGNYTNGEREAELLEQINILAHNQAILLNEIVDLSQQVEQYKWYEYIASLGMNNLRLDLENIGVTANATEEQLNVLLTGTPLDGYGWSFLYAERKYSVNALVLIGLMRIESGLGASALAQRNNNLSGLSNGNGGWQRFANFDECIQATARLLRNNYLNEDGRFHRGTALWDVNILYCLNPDGSVDFTWTEIISRHAYNFIDLIHEHEGYDPYVIHY
jgi:beta-N-acetylglucosaminidase